MPQHFDDALKELNALLSIEGEDPDDQDSSHGSAELRRVRWTTEGCDLLIAVRPALSHEAFTDAFRISCDRLYDIQLTNDRLGHEVELLDQHPLLIDFLEGSVGLNFLGRVRDPLAAATAMYGAYQAYYKGWKHKTTKEVFSLAEMLTTNGGMLIGAPPRLADQYIDILRAHGTDPYFYPAHQRGTPAVVEFAGGEAPRLLSIGWSYIVGSGFHVERVPREHLDAP